ncbi:MULTISPECIES: GNAT family N-acetyltransferase [unclassified Streptomyces]|uniref:GNAT family N-acetyltransferase n=1 Tax=Streptomycetaceae TaxID=2062 RepID=UPI002E765DCE|nr:MULTISPECIES: GNAT family N-acetyltransferase [unclassified Streptomyces]MED7950845.1 GNAT family N-acetyltransferase [Streptomyces sp. BE303]MEE1826106.1 GNAT family N-acetyltransferase [Streptomyces sp. BE20]
MAASFPETAISTERLLLRPLAEDDAAGLATMMADELVLAWTDLPHPFTESYAAELARSLAPAHRAAGRGIVFAVTEHLTQRLVGLVELRATDWRLRSTEIAFVTAAWARGEGYAPEAVLGVAQWLFEDRGFLRLEMRTAAGNTAAQQVAQKIGGISEGVLRSAWIVRGEAGEVVEESRSDLILWSLLPEDMETPDTVQAGAWPGDRHYVLRD